MLCTSIAFYVVTTRVLGWRKRYAAPLVAVFLAVDLSFVIASLPKIPGGGYIPLGDQRGGGADEPDLARRPAQRWRASWPAQQTPVDEVIDKLPSGVGSSRGTMVFLTPDPRGVPFLARHRWIRDRALEERMVLLNIARATTPYLESEERVFVERLSLRLIRVTARFGYMETPRIDPILRACSAFGLDLDRDDTSFFYADPKIEPAPPGKGMPGWRRELFVTLQRNARPLPDDLKIRAERRIELGRDRRALSGLSRPAANG